MIAIVYLLFALNGNTTVNAFFSNAIEKLPFLVFHNLNEDNFRVVLPLIQQRDIISISLRQTNSLDTLEKLIKHHKEVKSTCKIGASTVVSILQA